MSIIGDVNLENRNNTLRKRNLNIRKSSMDRMGTYGDKSENNLMVSSSVLQPTVSQPIETCESPFWGELEAWICS